MDDLFIIQRTNHLFIIHFYNLSTMCVCNHACIQFSSVDTINHGAIISDHHVHYKKIQSPVSQLLVIQKGIVIRTELTSVPESALCPKMRWRSSFQGMTDCSCQPKIVGWSFRIFFDDQLDPFGLYEHGGGSLIAHYKLETLSWGALGEAEHFCLSNCFRIIYNNFEIQVVLYDKSMVYSNGIFGSCQRAWV